MKGHQTTWILGTFENVSGLLLALGCYLGTVKVAYVTSLYSTINFPSASRIPPILFLFFLFLEKKEERKVETINTSLHKAFLPHAKSGTHKEESFLSALPPTHSYSFSDPFNRTQSNELGAP
jgi:hypothetical protein